jgi:hypothetical protein
MNRKTFLPIILFNLLSTFLVSSPGVEISFSLNHISSTFVSSYTNYNNPQFMNEKDTITAGYQKISLKASKKIGFSMGFNIMFAHLEGVELSYSYQSLPLIGTTTPYKVFLSYIYLQLPDYTPVPTVLTPEYACDKPTGTFIQKTFSLNFLKRFLLSQNLSLDLSHGFSLFNISGSYSNIAYSYYWLGGHSVLFSEIIKLRVGIKSVKKIGLNFREKLNFKTSKHFTFFITVSGYYCPTIHAKQEVLKIVKDYISSPPPDYEKDLNLSTLDFNPSFLSIGFGFNFGF